jgi:hypothetical protein
LSKASINPQKQGMKNHRLRFESWIASYLINEILKTYSINHLQLMLDFALLPNHIKVLLKNKKLTTMTLITVLVSPPAIPATYNRDMHIIIMKHYDMITIKKQKINK